MASSFQLDAIGTRWEIETQEPLEPALQRRILARIEEFDRTYSRFRSDSLVSRVAAAPDGGAFEFPGDSLALFALYDQLHAVTDGAVDPLVGRDLELLGYDPAYTLTPVPTALRSARRGRWSADVHRVGRTVLTSRPVVIDVGAVGKGFLVDLVAGILCDHGIHDFVVDGSGDLRHQGALCASAVTRRAWGDGLHHVLDGRTGEPVRDVVATWAVADDAATADGLATALFFASPAALAQTFSFSYVRMFADGRADWSSSFVGEVFS